MSSTANSIYQTKREQQWLAFDPRTKILLLIELDILLFLGRSLAYEASVFLFCALILLVGGQNKTALKCAGIFLLFVLTQHLIQPYLANSFASFVHFIVVVVRKVLPAFMLAKWLVATTEVSAFVAAMWKCKIPQSAIVTTSVIFRCFPTISEEWSAIKTAMKMRGIEFNFKNMVTKPSETIVHILVPLFMDEIAVPPKKRLAASYMVMQEVNHQLFTDSVEEEIVLGVREPSEERLKQVLLQMDIAMLKERHPMSLSGGQKQRVAIGAAVFCGKTIVVFDEPTSGLDFSHMMQTVGLLEQLKSPDIYIFVITHDYEFILSACDEVIEIENGTMKTDYLLDNMGLQKLRRFYLINANSTSYSDLKPIVQANLSPISGERKPL